MANLANLTRTSATLRSITDRIHDKLSRLCESVPDACDNRHPNYQLKTPISESSVSRLERKYQIQLPAEYRLFITEIGNGGVGPFKDLESFPDSELQADLNLLNTPFPFTRSLIQYDITLDEYLPISHDVVEQSYNGIWRLAHHGCAQFSVLIVTGPDAGHVWWQDWANDKGMLRYEDYLERYEGKPVSGRYTFLPWLEHWAEAEVAWLRKHGPLTPDIPF